MFLFNSRKLNVWAFSLILTLASFVATTAQTTTFGQFLQFPAAQHFVFTNNGTNGEFKTISGGTPVLWVYSNITGLPASLEGAQNARVFVTTTTTQNGAPNGGNTEQPLDQILTVEIIRDTPTPVGVGGGTRRNLLTAVFTGIGANKPALVGATGGSSATLDATTPNHTVTYYSDFLHFTSTTDRNLSFGFTSVNPQVMLNGNFLQSFAAAGTGTFASNPPPTPFVPTAGPVSIGGRVLTSNSAPLRNAKVALVDAQGTVYFTRTSSLGKYRFDDIPAGQTLVVSISSKRYNFLPRVIMAEDNIIDLDFMPESEN